MTKELREIKVTFEVWEDDLPSEKVGEYRGVIDAALEHYRTVANKKDAQLIEKLFWDYAKTAEESREEDFNFRLDGYIKAVQNKVTEYYKQFPNSGAPKIDAQVNKKYIRVVFTEGGNPKSVHTFIDRENGNVLKAAGWQGPEKRNPRSNIFDEDFGASGVTQFGAVYLR